MTGHEEVRDCTNPAHTNPSFACPDCQIRCTVCGPGECPVLERQWLDQQKENAS